MLLIINAVPFSRQNDIGGFADLVDNRLSVPDVFDSFKTRRKTRNCQIKKPSPMVTSAGPIWSIEFETRTIPPRGKAISLFSIDGVLVKRKTPQKAEEQLAGH